MITHASGVTPQDPIYAALQTIFHDVFMRDDIVLRPELTANDVDGWDSFKMIEILISVQEAFGLQLSSRELDSLKSVGDLAALIATRGRVGADA